MNLDEIQLPPKHPELIELEERRRKLRAQRANLEGQLRQVETAWSRLVMANESESDALAEQLASGEIDKISTENLPAQQTQLRAELEIVAKSDHKVAGRLARERTRHENQIIKAFRPSHKAAVQRIARAVEELVEANASERAVRHACPVPLVNLAFPNVSSSANNVGAAEYWRQYAERLGFFEPDDAPRSTSTPKAKRKLFASRTNGATEPAAALAAKGAE